MSYESAVRLTPVEAAIAGISMATGFTAADETNGNKFECVPGQTLLFVKNASGAPITVTIDVTKVYKGLTIADQTVNVPATTGFVCIGRFDADLHFQPGTNDVLVTFSDVTTVTVKVVHIATP